MAADGGVTAALASAKKTLSNVAHSNVNTSGGHAWSSPGAYHTARAARQTPNTSRPEASGLKGEAESAGAGIKSRMETEDAARKSLSTDNQ